MAHGKAYVILVDRVSEVHANALIGFLRGDEDVGWWHWYRDAWIVLDGRQRDATWWRDRMTAVMPGANCLVLGLDRSWAGTSLPKHFEWLKEHIG